MVNGKEKLSRNWKQIANDLFIVHPDLNATEVRVQLIALLGNEKTPGISSVQKEWARLRFEYEKHKHLDIPWHLGLMTTNNIPSEALPYIFMVQNHADTHSKPFTLRQAIWVSRLYGIINVKSKKDFKKLIKSIAYYLYEWSNAYATRERVCELSPNSNIVDTSHLDKMLRSGGDFITVEKTTIAHYPDGSIEIDTIDENLLRQMVSMKKDGEK